jgi:CBS domain-containing protein
MVTRKIKTIMNKEVITASPDDKVKDVVKLLAEHDISGMPVVDEDKSVIGMISERDILTALKSESRTLEMVFPSSHALGMTFEESINYRELKVSMKEIGKIKIEKIMKKELNAVKETATLGEVASIMVKNNVNRVPVVKNNKLVGIVTRGDIILGLSKV